MMEYKGLDKQVYTVLGWERGCLMVRNPRGLVTALTPEQAEELGRCIGVEFSQPRRFANVEDSEVDERDEG